MKLLSTMLTAAIIAAGSTVAMAQSAESDSTAKPTAPQGADANPSSPGANPAAGNPGGAPMAEQQRPGMVTAPVAGRPNSPASPTQPNSVGPQNPANKSDSGTGGGDASGK